MFDSISRKIILTVADNPSVRRIVTKYGMATPSSFARRFVAGETLDEAVEAVKDLNEKGITATLDLLGESVNTVEETRSARDQVIEILDKIHETGIDSNVSVKLTQLGLDLGDDICTENVKAILMRAKQYDNFVRIDMEGSDYTQRTLDIFKYMFDRFSGYVGIVLQSYLYRTESDVRQMNQTGSRVRLCKGAYREPEIVAFRKKEHTDLNYVRCLELLLTKGVYPAVATHDEDVIEKTKELAAKHEIAKEKFEFQMLYGIRRDLQNQLVEEGYRMRVYIPFGSQWYPYYSRRLGERLGNVFFILKNLYLDE